MDPAPRCLLLGLPLEIRTLIYELCYLGPHPDEPTSEPKAKPKRKRRRLGKEFEVQQWPPVTKCTHPSSHLNLKSVSRQIRNEYFPIFARHHILSIFDPDVFVNDHLSYTPDHLVCNIRHLSIEWQKPLRGCQCAGGAPYSMCKSGQDSGLGPWTPAHDLQNLLTMVRRHPEIFNSLEHARLRVALLPCYIVLPAFATRQSLLKYGILLVEELVKLRRGDPSDVQQQKSILTYQMTRCTGTKHQLNIFAVSDKTWEMLVDENVLYEKASEDPLPARIAPVRSPHWVDLHQFSSAVHDGILYHGKERTLWPQGLYEVYEKKDWKVVFNEESQEGRVPLDWARVTHELNGGLPNKCLRIA